MAATLQIQQDENQNFMLMQRQWAGVLNPLLRAPLSNVTLLPKVSLQVGTNIIPHGLGVPLTGWIIVRQRALSQIYDNQDQNTTPAQTLLLVASIVVVVDLMVF